MHLMPAADYTRAEFYARTRGPVIQAKTLPREAYVDEDFFAVERERVFAADWVAVGCVDEIRHPGDVKVADVGGRSVIVVRGRDGELRAFYNVCRHRGARLIEDGECNVGRFLRCPYHRWAYDLDGRCAGTPLFDGSGIPDDQRQHFATDHATGFDRRDYGLLGVASATFGPVVLVNLDPDPEPLAVSLGDLPERLAGYRLDGWRLARTAHYRVAANYKLIAENFMEYYHLPWVHPGLVRVSPLEAHHRWQGTGMYSGMCTSPIAPDTEDGGWRGLEPVAGLNADDAVSARFIWLFPNIALNVMPNHVFLIHVTPVAAGVTDEATYLLTRAEAVDEPDAQHAIDRLAAFWDKVNREDVAIVERVQKGLATTPFPGGPMCYRFEEPVHRFQNMLADRMIGLRRVPAGDAPS
jgi:phenylpropionate dioxygenase-like ring-hydroxylating dioxygenase large terminal subunit